MTKNSKPARQSHLRWVAADDLRVNPATQREFNQNWANQILANFDIDKFQVPHVNQRDDGSLFIMEGQHGTWAYRQFVGEGQKIQVWLYEGLTEEEEAEFFLSLNNKKSIPSMAKFKAAVVAGREEECDIDRIVRANGCRVGNGTEDNQIGAVGALTTIYRRAGGPVLGQTLRVIHRAFTDGGYERPVMLGVAMVLARYPELDEKQLVKQLSSLSNGWKGVIQKTSIVKEAFGVTQNEAAPAAVVDIYNSGKGGKKLPSWWREAA